MESERGNLEKKKDGWIRKKGRRVKKEKKRQDNEPCVRNQPYILPTNTHILYKPLLYILRTGYEGR